VLGQTTGIRAKLSQRVSGEKTLEALVKVSAFWGGGLWGEHLMTFHLLRL